MFLVRHQYFIARVESSTFNTVVYSVPYPGSQVPSLPTMCFSTTAVCTIATAHLDSPQFRNGTSVLTCHVFSCNCTSVRHFLVDPTSVAHKSRLGPDTDRNCLRARVQSSILLLILMGTPTITTSVNHWVWSLWCPISSSS